VTKVVAGLAGRLLARLRTGEMRGITYGVLTSGAAMGIAYVLNYVVIIVLSRMAPKADVGTFSYIISTATILATLADFGMTNALTRAYHAASGDERARLLAMSLSVRGAVSAALGLGCVLSGAQDLGWVGLLVVFWLGDSLLLFLNARMDFRAAAGARILTATLYFGGSLLLYLWTRDPGLTALGRGISFLVAGAWVGWRVLDRRAFRGWSWAGLRRLARMGADYFALSASSAVFGHIDVVLLAWLLTREDVGLYRPLFTLAIVPSMLSMVVNVPLNAVVSSREWRDRRVLLGTVHTLVGVLTAVSVAITVVGWVLAPWLLRVVLGPGYVEGADLFRIILVASALRSLTSPYNSFIMMRGRVGPLIALALVNTAGLVVLDLVLIPLHGTAGAAWARLGVQLLGVVGMLWYFYAGFVRDVTRPAPPGAEEAVPPKPEAVA
jgi:O-antigen/teichoic acid export membrane protein